MSVPLEIRLDRSSPLPLYYQLAAAFEQAIHEGSLNPGDRVENEVALAERLNLSRPTTRRAMQELVDKGLVVRKRGVGTQVVQAPLHRQVELTSLYDDLMRAGKKPGTSMLEYRPHPADAEVARELNLQPGDEVVLIRRLRTSDGEPIALMSNYLPAEIVPPEEELAARGLYEVLRVRGVHIRIARQRIGAQAASRDEAVLLEEKTGAPLLTMQRTAFDDAGRAVEFGKHLYRANRYSFETTLVGR
ncbi:GntR family transcriptional regulator [Hoyosella subflava]|uniref:Transcriptional regulator, GntR family n=1 Tax=Hoyosella subflava (strain DSM 45089 / JCM 17490 / NBRC 109087 / DQS3-9A1) TaxID=443218 RepID=F6EHN7_HOYSD|nr:GntR family transcriptional regulator [Hoyosella subflava]AEF42401.1 Transcriptional regulator, GntR family [Hoyosella subflava DQS3-9A1]